MKSLHRLYMLIAFGITLILVIVAPLRLSRELTLLPAWSVSVDDSGAGTPDFKAALGLEYPGRLVFVDEDGAYQVYPVPSRLARGTMRFALWTLQDPGFSVRNRDGSLVSNHPNDPSIPVFTDHGYAAVHRSGSGFAWYDNTGLQKWTWSGVYPIISIVANARGQVFVLDLAGFLTVIGADGTAMEPWVIPDSRVKTGLGMSLLKDDTLAIVGGLEPQQVFLVQVAPDTGKTTLQWSRQLDSSYRRDVLVQSIINGDWFVLEQEAGLLLLKSDGSKAVLLRQSGWIRKVFEHPGYSLILVLRDAAEGSYFELWSLGGEKLGSLGPSAAIHDAGLAGEDMVVLAGDEGLLGLDLVFK